MGHLIFLTPKVKGVFRLGSEVHVTFFFLKQEICPLEPKFPLAIELILSYVYMKEKEMGIYMCVCIYTYALFGTHSQLFF